MARIAVLMVVAALAAMPAAALGATGDLTPPAAPSQPLLQNQVQEAPAPAPADLPESPSEGRIGPGELLLVVLAVVVLIGGIWFAISRDARRATRGRTPQPAGSAGLGGGGSATRAARRSRKLSSAERRRRKHGKAH